MDSSPLKPFTHQNPLLPKTLISLKTPLKPSLPLIPRQPHLSRRRRRRLRCSAVLKPAAVTLTAAAALFLSRFPSPSLASPLPIPQPETLTLTDDLLDSEQTLDSNLNDPRSLRPLLDVKIKSNEIPEAISVLDRLIELEPDDLDLQLLKSHLLIQSGDVNSARHFIEQVIHRNPFSVEAYNALIMANREAEEGLDGILERVEKAMEMCKKAKRREDLRDFKLLKAQVKVCEGKYEEAIRVYEELVKEEPRDFRPYLCEGIVYSLMMKKEEAEKKFEKYRRLVPKGHQYRGFFDDNVIAMKVFGQMEENRRTLKI